MKLNNNKEFRKLVLPKEKQTRASSSTGDTSQRYIQGTAIVFNSPSKVMASWMEDDIVPFTEVIMPTALDDVLASSDLDVIYNIDHDNSRMVARSKSGTLTITKDSDGVNFKALVPNTTAGNDLYEHVSLGNYSENSFCFVVSDERWEEGEDGEWTRYIDKIDSLFDLSSVINPAYNGTKLSLRGMDHFSKIKTKGETKSELDLIDLELSILHGKL